MPGLIIWKNQEIDRLRRDMDRLLARIMDDFSILPFPRMARETLAMDLAETEETLVLTAEIPGITPDDLEVFVTDDNVTIKADLRQNLVTDGEDYEVSEQRYGYISRTIQLPCKVLRDEVKATYKEGLLSVVLPKCKTETPKGIRIKVT